MTDESFGEALRRLRGSRSVRDVAHLANCGKSYVSDLELGKRQPTRDMAAALDAALDAALGADGELIALADVRPDLDPLAQADALQRGLQEALAAGPLTSTSLDEVDFTVARHGRATRQRPEARLLPELLADFNDLRLMLTGRRSAPVRKRLLIATARMAGLMALTLLKMKDDRSRAWWRTGRAAAAAAEDRATLSWTYAQEAYQLYDTGDLAGAVELAGRARRHSQVDFRVPGPHWRRRWRHGPTPHCTDQMRRLWRWPPQRQRWHGCPQRSGQSRRSGTRKANCAST
ncbi:helix-turn-helix domain-containing protein [Streptomyces sp. NPDC002018]|uniref:helix-turn-helix domain-containing protein n=1 Tax=Streptomyces sp. NPDC002018 TaxID=3364629 RepID=UPI003674FC75